MVLARWLRWPSTVSRVPDTRRSSRAFGSTWPYPAGWFSDWPERAWMERSKGRRESAGDAPSFSQICINTAEQTLQRWHRVVLDSILDPDDRGAVEEEWTQLVTDLQRCAAGVHGVADGSQLHTAAKLFHAIDGALLLKNGAAGLRATCEKALQVLTPGVDAKLIPQLDRLPSERTVRRHMLTLELAWLLYEQQCDL